MARSPPFAEHGSAGIDNVRKGESPYMTVQNQNVKNVYRGNGSTTVFPFTFAINESHPEYIHVYITNDGGKAAETTDFTCDMETRTITYPKPTSSAPKLSATQRLTIYRLLPYEQNLNLVNQGPFFSEDVETQLDDLEMQIQQLNEEKGRSLRIGLEVTDFETEIPLVPGKTFRVNDAGTGFELTEDPKAAREAAEAAQAAAEEAQGKAEDAQEAAEQAQEDAEDAKEAAIEAKDAAEDIASQIDIMARALVHDNVASMVADTTLKAGQTTATKGYFLVNDGGNGFYNIRGKNVSEVDDGGSIIFLDNGKVAELITNGVVNVKQFGAVGDGVQDDTSAFQKAVDYCETLYKDVPAASADYHSRPDSFACLYVPDGVYVIESSIEIHTILNIKSSKGMLIAGENIGTNPLFISSSSSAGMPSHKIFVDGLGMIGFYVYFDIDNDGRESSYYYFNRIDVKNGETFIQGNLDSSVLVVQNSQIERITHITNTNADKTIIQNNWITMGYLVDDFDATFIVNNGEFDLIDNLFVPNNPALRPASKGGPVTGKHEYAWIKVENPARVYVRRNHFGGELGGASVVNWNADFISSNDNSTYPSVLVVEENEIQLSQRTDLDITDSIDYKCGIRLFQLPNLLVVKNNWGFNQTKYIIGTPLAYDSVTDLFSKAGSSYAGYSHSYDADLCWDIDNNVSRYVPYLAKCPSILEPFYNTQTNKRASYTYASDDVTTSGIYANILLRKPLMTITYSDVIKVKTLIKIGNGNSYNVREYTVNYASYYNYDQQTYTDTVIVDKTLEIINNNRAAYQTLGELTASVNNGEITLSVNIGNTNNAMFVTVEKKSKIDF